MKLIIADYKYAKIFKSAMLDITQQNWKCLHVRKLIANVQSFTSQIFGVVDPLGENLDVLVRWDLTFKPGGVHKHFFDRDARPRTNFNYPKK